MHTFVSQMAAVTLGEAQPQIEDDRLWRGLEDGERAGIRKAVRIHGERGDGGLGFRLRVSNRERQSHRRPSASSEQARSRV